MTRELALSGDLARPYIVVACALGLLSFALLLLELYRATRGRTGAIATALTGGVAVVALLAAVLRPVAVVSKGTLVGPKVVVLADASRSIELPGISGTRRQTLEAALAGLADAGKDVRFRWLRFGEGPAEALSPPPSEEAGANAEARGAAPRLGGRLASRSDLHAALEAIAGAADELPAAVVVLSDGRLDRPGALHAEDATRAALGNVAMPVHTVALATDAPADASIRAVRAAGAAVAHQPLSLQIDIGCAGGLACSEVRVVARELRERGAPTTLASGVARVVDGVGTVELSMTLDRAGTRILEVSLEAPEGDQIPDNDRRFVTIDVTRERVRVLHVAGRPTYDVRALRTWLKSDASVDVVAFFILRTHSDVVNADQSELALIPFPVDELFTKHLPSFDAVVLQDFNASPYGLTQHLGALARYVDKGGGLILVGGPDAFVPGNYARTPLAAALPVSLEIGRDETGVDLGSFTPRLTPAGRVAPVLGPLRALLGDDLPDMPGTNVVGDARPGAMVLLEHPSRRTATGAAMPVLALGEHGSGRTIALTLDGSHKLSFSAFAAGAAGRGHGAFWDAMLGWLMRDPRFEPAAVELPAGCVAGERTRAILRPLPGAAGEARLIVTRLGNDDVVASHAVTLEGRGDAVEVDLEPLEPGGYSISVEVAARDGAAATSTRRDVACERGGDEWADSRPDPERLQAIARATGGSYVVAGDVGSLKLPAGTQVAAERHVSAILPPWALTFMAALAMGAHWIVRRRGGLS